MNDDFWKKYKQGLAAYADFACTGNGVEDSIKGIDLFAKIKTEGFSALSRALEAYVSLDQSKLYSGFKEKFASDPINNTLENYISQTKGPKEKFSFSDQISKSLSLYEKAPPRDIIYSPSVTDKNLVDRGAVYVTLLPGQRFFPELVEFESKYARNTSEEFNSRNHYRGRNDQLLTFVHQQLTLNDDNMKVSVGVEGLLDVAMDFVGNLSDEELRDYKAEGCDIHYSLLKENGEVDALPPAVGMAQTCVAGIKDPRRNIQSYSAENAIRVVRALVSIAEYERFKTVQPRDFETKKSIDFPFTPPQEKWISQTYEPVTIPGPSEKVKGCLF
jgi:hypothetical protein